MMDAAVGGAMKGQTMAAAGEEMGKGLGAAPSAPHGFAKADVQEGEKLPESDETPGESTGD